MSVYIATYTKYGLYYVRKNTVSIANGRSSLTEYVQTASVTVIEHLAVNDTISVTGDMYVYGNYESCLTILQIKLTTTI